MKGSSYVARDADVLRIETAGELKLEQWSCRSTVQAKNGGAAIERAAWAARSERA